nr:MAG TPA: hypothetical protein [Caudoviricetes sp.]
MIIPNKISRGHLYGGGLFFALCAGHYLNHVRPTDEALLSVNRLLAESRLKITQKSYALKRTRTALKTLLIFRNETTPLERVKRARERDRRE